MISSSVVRFRETCREKTRALMERDPQLSPTVARMLVARGITTPEAVDRYFSPAPEALHSPFLLKGMEQAVELLSEALFDGTKILICGDYDCDGICATTLLMEALAELGAEVDYHIPDRFEEGYGLSVLAVERCQQEGFGLLITVDCGSSSHQAIDLARASGIKTIITDHHAVPPEAPNADAFVNPQQEGCSYPFKGICGAGVAYKLVQALNGESGDQPRHLLDLVALATVADVVPLVDENRVLVQFGLQELQRTQRVGIAALMKVAGRPFDEEIDSMTMGFTLGPRLNAAGRLEHARIGVELLSCGSERQAERIATHLNELNESRKEKERAVSQEVKERLESEPERWQRGVIVEWGEGWHEGVIGITAGRLADRYGVPALIISVRDGMAKGSARSPENVDMFQALSRCKDLFTRFGGHPRAGGLSLPAERLPELVEQMTVAVNELRTGPNPVWIDDRLTLDEASLELVGEIEQMEPFGEANSQPTFLLEGVEIVNRRLVGRTGDHLMLEVKQAGVQQRAIAFGQADLAEKLIPDEFFYDLRCQIGRNFYRNREELNVQVLGVVEPVCQRQDGQSAVLDLRHKRARRQGLLHWLKSEPSLVAVCQDPAKAATLHAEFASRFTNYASIPKRGSGLLLLTPPQSLQQFDSFVEAVAPERLIVLFGPRELERALQAVSTAVWDRKTAIKVWRLFGGLKESLRLSDAVHRAKEQLGLEQGVTEAILEAFVETGAALRQGQLLTCGKASGMRLEETNSYTAQNGRLDEVIEVRDYFSRPDLQERLGERVPCLSHSLSQDSLCGEQIFV